MTHVRNVANDPKVNTSKRTRQPFRFIIKRIKIMGCFVWAGIYLRLVQLGKFNCNPF